MAKSNKELDELVKLIDISKFLTSFDNSAYEFLYFLASKLPETTNLIPKSRITKEVNDLIQNQLPDGSWVTDEKVDSIPDKIIMTLISLLVINKYSKKSTTPISKAKWFILRSIGSIFLIHDPKKTIGFESISTDLINRAIGEKIFGNELKSVNFLLKKLKDTKLKNKISYLYNSRSTIHSVLDAFYSSGNIKWNKIAQLQEENGSMGIYPSSTIALLDNISPSSQQYKKGINYLDSLLKKYNGLPPFYPSEYFELYWSLLALSTSPLKNILKNKVSKFNKLPVPHEGVSVSNKFSLPDVDTSAVIATVYNELSIPVSLDFLTNFFHDGVFKCYVGENRTSPSANIHALMALTSRYRGKKLPEKYHTMFNASLHYLIDQIGNNGHFQDKWHFSNLYTTSHAIELFLDILTMKQVPQKTTSAVRTKILQIIEWINDSNHDDGGFGVGKVSSLEETGYAVRAILKSVESGVIELNKELIDDASNFLNTNTVENDLPLWIGKTLYKSKIITQSQKISALSMIQNLTI